VNLLQAIKKGLKGYRKFIAYLLALTSSALLLIYGYINGDNFAAIVGGGLVAFVSANVGEHLIGGAKEIFGNEKK